MSQRVRAEKENAAPFRNINSMQRKICFEERSAAGRKLEGTKEKVLSRAAVPERIFMLCGSIFALF